MNNEMKTHISYEMVVGHFDVAVERFSVERAEFPSNFHNTTRF